MLSPALPHLKKIPYKLVELYVSISQSDSSYPVQGYSEIDVQFDIHEMKPTPFQVMCGILISGADTLDSMLTFPSTITSTCFFLL